MNTIKQQARAAGRLYFLLAIIAPIGLMYVPGKLLVANDATATADNLRASAGLFRVGIASELIHQALAVFLVLALYRLFKGVNEGHARHLVVLGALVSVPIMLVNVLNEIAALILVSGVDYLSVFARSQLDALAYLFLRLHDRGITIASIFWGLWLFPFGRLVIRSGFIPRIFGYLLMIAGAAYLASAFTTLVLPQYASLVGRVALPLEVAEVPIIFWLLIWGARTRQADTPGQGPARHVIAPLLVILATGLGCTDARSDAERTQEPVVGGPCEGCDAVFVGLPSALTWSSRIAPADEPGESLLIDGAVTDRHGHPASGVVVYAYHTDVRGHYPTEDRAGNRAATRHGTLRGWALTDGQGHYRFETIRPAGYPGTEIPAHVHLHVIEVGRCTYYIDDILFDDDPRLTAAERRHASGRGGNGIAMPQQDSTGTWLVRRDIVLGEGIADYPGTH